MASTTKQIADLLGCSKMRVYRYIQRERISETFCNGSVKYYDDDTVSAIIEALKPVLDGEFDRNDALRNVTEIVTERNDTQQIVTERNTETLIEMLREQLAAKDKQLSVKDEQLAAKDKQIEALNVALNTAQQTIADTTAALTAAQALHAGTLQRLTTVSGRSEDDNKDEQEQAQPTKKGFFSRLFRK